MEFWQLMMRADRQKDGEAICNCSQGDNSIKRARYSFDLNFDGSYHTNSCETSRGGDVESSTLSQCSSKGPSPAFTGSQSVSPAVSESQLWINCNERPVRELQEQDLIGRLEECSDANSVDCTLSLGIGPPLNLISEQATEPATPVSSPTFAKILFPGATSVHELRDSKREVPISSSSRINFNVDHQTNSAFNICHHLSMHHEISSAYASARMPAQKISEADEQSRMNRVALGAPKSAPFISANGFPYNNYMGRTIIGESINSGSGVGRPLYKWNAAAGSAATANNNIACLPVVGYCRSGNSMDAKEIQLLRNYFSLRVQHNKNNNNSDVISNNRMQVQKVLGRNDNIDSENAVSHERKCSACETTTTPLWRNGPKGAKSLCNACGIRYKKEERRAAASAMAAAPTCTDNQQQLLPFSQRDHHQITNPNFSNGLDAATVDTFNLQPSKKLKMQSSKFVSCTTSTAT